MSSLRPVRPLSMRSHTRAGPSLAIHACVVVVVGLIRLWLGQARVRVEGRGEEANRGPHREDRVVPWLLLRQLNSPFISSALQRFPAGWHFALLAKPSMKLCRRHSTSVTFVRVKRIVGVGLKTCTFLQLVVAPTAGAQRAERGLHHPLTHEPPVQVAAWATHPAFLLEGRKLEVSLSSRWGPAKSHCVSCKARPKVKVGGSQDSNSGLSVLEECDDQLHHHPIATT